FVDPERTGGCAAAGGGNDGACNTNGTGVVAMGQVCPGLTAHARPDSGGHAENDHKNARGMNPGRNAFSGLEAWHVIRIDRANATLRRTVAALDKVVHDFLNHIVWGGSTGGDTDIAV